MDKVIKTLELTRWILVCIFMFSVSLSLFELEKRLDKLEKQATSITVERNK